MVFPEGTCGNQSAIFRLSQGAFSTGRNQVQLVLFKFPYTHFNPCYTGSNLGGHEFWDLLWRSCCQFVQYMEVQFVPPYMPTDAEVADPTCFADNMQKVMASHLHVKICPLNGYKLYREVFAEYMSNQKKERTSWRLRRQLGKVLAQGDCLRRSGSKEDATKVE